jgi:uncharacterized protein YbjT (DUF2867 family)
MKIVLFGATGMVGSGSLIECLDSEEVREVLVVGRRSCGVEHEKLSEVIVDDMFDYSAVQARFAGADACFFCLGISSAGMSEQEYHRITYELTVAAAESLAAVTDGMTFCYISGAGAYSSEEGPMMWARVRGRVENKLAEMDFDATWIFRPGFIQPVRGVRSRTALYNAVYTVGGPFTPLLSRIAPSLVTTTKRIGRALIRVARDGAAHRVLNNRDINRLAE